MIIFGPLSVYDFMMAHFLLNYFTGGKPRNYHEIVLT